MITNLLIVFLQAAPGGGGAMMPVLLVGMIVIMYFFMIRPQQKKAKEQKKFAQEIGINSRVVTTSGIHGRILSDNGDGTIVLKVDKNTSFTIERSAISMELTNAANQKAGVVNNTTAAIEEPTK